MGLVFLRLRDVGLAPGLAFFVLPALVVADIMHHAR